ncbi:hypothetical protein [Rossellomorea sp. BNER]|uniref:hypothetical protein n=1 Tax=Rossellomorea sp. BNER TaxID=2962031 RepID=UPI003AF26A0E|nr:hypothetical protein [Rossellomorea sp. BNER]
MGRTKRIERSAKEIRNVIENQGLKYILVNNDLFKLYKQGKYNTGETIKDKKTGEEKDLILNFDARFFSIYIGLKFLDQIDFFGYKKEVASFIKEKLSERRLRERLDNLKKIKMPVNNRFSKADGKHVLLENPKSVDLVRKRGEIGFERNRKVKTDRWFCPWDCNRKLVKTENGKELKPYDFFAVTIYDFDLYRNGILNDEEFVLYLYLVKSYNSNDKDKKGIAQTVSKIAENLNVKNPDIVQKRLDKLVNLRVRDAYCNEGEDFPLLQTTKPKNHNQKLLTRNEPSLHYYPIYNDTTIEKINNKVEANEKEADGEFWGEDLNSDSDLNNSDTELIEDTHLYKTDTKINKTDTDHPF